MSFLKEKFKEVGRENSEIYKEDLSNIRESILGISGSYFMKKMFEGVYVYTDHSIGMSRRAIEKKVSCFKETMERHGIQTLVIFENQLSVRLNQRNSILKRAMVSCQMQFINTPYSEHAQLIYHFKSNLISGIVSDLDIIKYFSETNNYVIIDIDEYSDCFEWIHLSKFLASMHLTHHYAKHLLLQEQLHKKFHLQVIQQFDSIQKQKHFDRDSSVNHPTYKDQIFRIEYVPVLNLSCHLQLYKQTIEAPSMEDRMKKHFGIILSSTLYQFFAFDLISCDLLNLFGFQRFKYIPNVYDSRELRVLLDQTCQHYIKAVALIKHHLHETIAGKAETFNLISENDEFNLKDKQSTTKSYASEATMSIATQVCLNYEFVDTDLIYEGAFAVIDRTNQSNGNSFRLLTILTKYVNSIRGKNPSRKGSEAQEQTATTLQPAESRHKLSEDNWAIAPSLLNKGSSSSSQPSSQRAHRKQQQQTLAPETIFSLAALNFFHLQELIGLSRGQITQLTKYLCRCDAAFSEQLLIFSNIIQNENLCGIFFSNLYFDLDDIANAIKAHILVLASTAATVTTTPQNTQNQSPAASTTASKDITSTTSSNADKKSVSEPQIASSTPASQTSSSLPPPPSAADSSTTASPTSSKTSESNGQTTSSSSAKSFSQSTLGQSQVLFQKKLIDERGTAQDKLMILVISRVFALSEVSFREWNVEDHFDFELTQFIKIIQSVQSILRNQFDSLLLCSYAHLNNSANMQSIISARIHLPFRRNYNCGLGILMLLLLQNKMQLTDLLANTETFPHIKQELQQAFLLWDNIFDFVRLQRRDKYVDPSIFKIAQILDSSNDFLHAKIYRQIIFED